MRIVRAYAWLLVVGLGLAATPGCGSPAPEAEEPAVRTAEPAPAEEPEDVIIPGEKFDAIERFFDRKRPIIARCLSDAIDEGEVPESVKGYVTLGMTIRPDGSLADLEIVETTIESKTLASCVLDRARRWTVTSLPRSLPYSYSFGFNTL